MRRLLPLALLCAALSAHADAFDPLGGSAFHSSRRFGKSLLIAEDANTVCHTYWDGTTIKDTKGCAWTQVGTVPMVAASGKFPPGAGAFSDANYYTTSAFDMGANGTLCIVYRPNTLTTNVIAANSSNSYLQIGSTETGAHWNGDYVPVAASTALAPNVLCTGRTAVTSYSKINNGTIASAATTTVSTGLPTYLGRYPSAGFGADATIYEVYFTTTAPSDALLTAIESAALARLQ